MKRAKTRTRFGLAVALAAGLGGCDGEEPGAGLPLDHGTIQVALLSAPADAGCVRVTAAGARTVTASFDLTPGQRTVFSLARLPIGVLQVDAAAFPGACMSVGPDAVPSWVSEAPVDVRVDPHAAAEVVLRLIRNARLSVGLDFEAPPWVSPGREPVDLAVIGDSPYGAGQVSDFPNLVAAINADPGVTGVVHLGDIKNGSSRCDTSYFTTIAGSFAAFEDPLVYTPGDNEWTDCHRANNGAYDPLERLEVLREIFYPVPGLALGGGRQQVMSQAFVGGLETFVENQLWLQAGVAFSALHVVGSNNNLAPWFDDDPTKMDDPVRREAEAAARIAAALDWLERSFALARDEDAAGVALLMQADTWTGGIVGGRARHDGFDPIIRKIADLARAFARPVLLLQGDSHVYRTDHPLAAGDAIYGVADPVPNLVRVVVQGSTTSEWLRLHVDPASPAVFSWTRAFR